MSELDEWAEDHSRRVLEEMAVKVRIEGLSRMQDRIRDEIIAEFDAEFLRRASLLKEIEDEFRTGQMGTGAPAPSQARADQADQASAPDQDGQRNRQDELSVH